MKLNKSLLLKEICQQTGCTPTVSKAVAGAAAPKDPQDLWHRSFVGVASLSKAQPCDVSFFYMDPLSQKQGATKMLAQTQAGACLVEASFLSMLPPQTIALVSENPKTDFAKVIRLFHPLDPVVWAIDPSSHIHPSAVIHPQASIGPFCVISQDVVIGKGCHVGPFCFLGPRVTLGENCTLGSHVSLMNTVLGKNVSIKPGARLGQDGFGFDIHTDVKVPHIGGVLIGDNVEIGANTAIDRGVLEDTFIGTNTHIDNLVQIGHNVSIGKKSIIAAQSGLGGSCSLGDSCILGGQVGIKGHIHLGAQTMVAAKSGIVRSSDPGSILAGIPAIAIKDWRRQVAHLARLGKRRQ